MASYLKQAVERTRGGGVNNVERIIAVVMISQFLWGLGCAPRTPPLTGPPSTASGAPNAQRPASSHEWQNVLSLKRDSLLRVRLCNGSWVEGRLFSIEGDGLTLSTPQKAQLKLDRAEMLDVYRCRTVRVAAGARIAWGTISAGMAKCLKANNRLGDLFCGFIFPFYVVGTPLVGAVRGMPRCNLVFAASTPYHQLNGRVDH